MLVESIAAGLVAVALLSLVLQPVLFPEASVPLSYDPPDPEETPRGQALLALKEIEFDRATGKLSDRDYEALNAKYSAVALAALDAPTASAPGAVHCQVHGARGEPDARFCAECGAGLVTAANSCAACVTPVPGDARFCPGCGVLLIAG